ncbi:MAG: DUF6049 family protein [Candidatus Geothermincolales bacterium]
MKVSRKLPILITAVTVVTLLFSFPPPASLAQEKTPQGNFILQVSTDRSWYAPDSTVTLTVKVGASPEEITGATEIMLYIYPSALTRSYLYYFRRGYRPNPRLTKRLGVLSPDKPSSSLTFVFSLSELQLKPGVYPFEVKAITEDGTRASDSGMLVIMELPPGSRPLQLALTWSADFLPPSDFQGTPLDQALDTAADPGGGGYLFSLLSKMRQYQVPSSLVLPGQVVAYLERNDGPFFTNGGGSDKQAELLSSMRELNELGLLEVVPTTYALADLDLLREEGLEEDGTLQLMEGREALERIGFKLSGLVHPGFRMGPAQLEAALRSGATFSLVSPDVVRESRQGEKLLQGTTLTQPVFFSLQDGQALKCLVVDDILYDLLSSSPRSDPVMQVQDIMAELAVLQREKPSIERGCVLAFPPSFIPGDPFLECLYSSLANAAWLETTSLGTLAERISPVKNVVLSPSPTFRVDSEFLTRLKDIKEMASAFSAALPEDQPLGNALKELVLLLENYRFTEGVNSAAAGRMLESAEGFLQEQVSKIRIIKKKSVTLSGLKGSLAVNVVNDLGFPVKAVMKLENRNLIFPQGQVSEITLLPRENQFVFPVEAQRKGSYVVEITLETKGYVLGRTNLTVNTSMINSLAIILLICLTALLSLISLFRWSNRVMRTGKHAKRD